MGLFDDIGDFVDDVGDAVSDVGDAVGDAVEAVADTVVDTTTDSVGFAGDIAAAALTVADATVFDAVDFATDGMVDVDFDNGTFSADIGIDGMGGVGVSVGENGLQASIDLGIASTDLGISDEGVSLAGAAGIDFGPLPYVNGHVDVSADGDVSVAGHVQGTIPWYGGLLSGEATVGLEVNDEGYAGSVAAEGTYTLASGTAIHGGVEAAYAEDEHGSRTSLGVEGSISEPGVGTIGGSAGYDRIEHDGTVIETGHVEGHASGYGMTVSAGEDYVGVTTDQGSVSQWTGNVDVKGLDANSLAQLGQALLGADDGTVSNVLGQAADQGALGSLLGQLDQNDTAALINRLVGADATGAGTAGGGSEPLVGSDPTGAVGTGTGLGLDADAVAGSRAPTGVMGAGTGGDSMLDDDVLGLTGTSAGAPAGAQTTFATDAFDTNSSPDAGGMAGTDVLGAGGLDTSGSATDGWDAGGDAVGADTSGFGGDPLGAGGVGPVVADPTGGAPAPSDDLSQAFDEADDVEASMDPMFDGLDQ